MATKAKVDKVKELTAAQFAKKMATLRASIDMVAVAEGCNTLAEVGICDDAMLSHVCDAVDQLYDGRGLPSDHWPYTPRIERCVVTMNTAFNTRMTGFHFWQVLHRARKDGTLSHSGAGKKAFTATSAYVRPTLPVRNGDKQGKLFTR